MGILGWLPAGGLRIGDNVVVDAPVVPGGKQAVSSESDLANLSIARVEKGFRVEQAQKRELFPLGIRKCQDRRKIPPVKIAEGSFVLRTKFTRLYG